MAPGPSRFARAVVALRWSIVAGWLAAAVAAVTLLPSIAESQTGALGDLVPNDAEALDAEIRASELFGLPLLSRTVIVQRDAAGLPAAAQARVVARAVRLNRSDLPGYERIGGALPVTNLLGRPPLSRKRSTTALTYLFYAPDVGAGERQELAERLAAERITAPGDAFVGVTGSLAAREEQAGLIGDALPLVEIGTVLLVLVVCGLHFRALGAPLITLLTIAVSYLVATHVMAGVGQRLKVSVPREIEPVVVVLLFGVITDYSIFYLTRFRAKLAAEVRPRQAVAATVTELTPIITTAGLTVVGASAALLVARLGFFQAFGPGTAIAIFVALLVSTTFLPACLALVGRAVFWPSRPGPEVPPEQAAEEARAEGTSRPVRRGLVGLATRRPGLVTAGTLLFLLACASGVLRTEVGNTMIRGLPPENDARRAYVAATWGFAPGAISPTVLLVEGPGITRRREDLEELQERIEDLPGVAQVVGPRQQPLERNLGAVYSRSRNAVRFLVVFDADPLGARAIALLRNLKDRFPALLARSELAGARLSVAGDTALSEETVRRVNDDLGRISLAVLAVVLLILGIFLRAVVAPLFLVAASVVALAAALGLTTYVFQDLLGYGELTFYVPFAAAVLLVALGSDYNVFLTGRVWQEARLRPFREAVGVGASRASRAITVAGIVLALSFALLAIVPVRAFRELAVVMCGGLLIDAFIVRTLLVPAVITLLGPASRWPSRFDTPSLAVAAAAPSPGRTPGSGAARSPSRGGLQSALAIAVVLLMLVERAGRRGRS